MKFFWCICILLAFGNCEEKQKILFFDLDEIELDSEYNFHLSEVLYLKPDLFDQLQSKVELYEYEDYIIDSLDTRILVLEAEHESIEGLIMNPSEALVKYLEDTFGFDITESGVLDDIVLTYNNEALCKFHDKGSIHALKLSLKTSSILQIGIAYIVMP